MNVDTSPIKRYQFDTLWELDADMNKIILGLKGVLTLNVVCEIPSVMKYFTCTIGKSVI